MDYIQGSGGTPRHKKRKKLTVMDDGNHPKTPKSHETKELEIGKHSSSSNSKKKYRAKVSRELDTQTTSCWRGSNLGSRSIRERDETSPPG